MLRLCACSLAALVLVATLTACGGGRQTAPLEQAAHPAPAAAPAIPAPAELQRHSSGGPEDYQRVQIGAQFQYSLAHHNVSTTGIGPKGLTGNDDDLLNFAPTAGGPGALQLGQTAYATFLFADANGYSGPTTMLYRWEVEPANYGNAWLALANFQTNRWDWFQMEADGSVDIGGWEPYSRDTPGQHELYALVLLAGADAASLDWLLMGETAAWNLSLDSDLSGTPADNIAPLTVNFDTSWTRIAGSTLAGFDWDFDNDGIYEVTDDQTGKAQHLYSQPGDYGCIVRVRAADGHEEQDYLNFTVVDPANTPPTADFTPDVASGNSPLPVTFDASSSTDNGSIIFYEWDLDGDGDYELSGKFMDTASYTYSLYGPNPVGLRVTDNDFATSTKTVNINLATGWRSSTISSIDNISTDLSMCTTGSGGGAVPCVVWGDQGDMHFCSGSSNIGSTWNMPLAPVDNSDNVGYSPSLVQSEGLAELLLTYGKSDGSGDYDLYFVSSTSLSGQAWHTPVLVDASGRIGSRNELALYADDRPMIASVLDSEYQGSNVLQFYRAGGLDGTSWGAPVVLGQATSGYYEGVNLMDAGGLPLISFALQGSLSSSLRTLSAASADGSSWDLRDVLGDGYFSGTAMLNWGGAPCLAGGTTSNGSGLSFFRAMDGQGKTWSPTPVEIVPAGEGGDPVMALIDGTPAIVYCRRGAGGALCFTQATDGTGQNWSEPQAIAPAVDIDYFYDLVDCNNHPVACYVDETDSELRSAWYQN